MSCDAFTLTFILYTSVSKFVKDYIIRVLVGFEEGVFYFNGIVCRLLGLNKLSCFYCAIYINIQRNDLKLGLCDFCDSYPEYYFNVA